MRIYVHPSALLKRVFMESESVALGAALRSYANADHVLVSSSLAWVEVSRAVRSYASRDTGVDVDAVIEAALSGLLEQPIAPEIIALARRLNPPVLRSLDAIHIAAALLLDADLVLAYDQRLLDAAAHNGLTTLSPSG